MEHFDPFVSVTGEQASLFENLDSGSRLVRKKSRGRSRGKIVTGKNFILDTNVLLHDPNCIQRFDDNHVWIPVDVLAELDKFKNEQSERGANARAVHRSLSKIFSQAGASVTEGVPTTGGGTLRLAVFDLGEKNKSPGLARFLRIFPDTERVDHRILATVLLLQEIEPAPAILVTKDLNMQLKGLAVGLQCEDYLNDKVEAKDVESYDPHLIEVDPYELQRFASSGELLIDAARIAHLALNEYVLLCAGERKTIPARLAGGGVFKRLQIPESLHIPRGIDLRPANLGQQCLIDALLDPSISLVTCYGQAGTGKTLLAVAAGLHAVFTKNFNGITISRPVVAMGDTLGFLPGSLEEKMRPWLQPIYDALEVLMPPGGSHGSHPAPQQQQKKSRKNYAADSQPAQQHTSSAPRKPYEHLIEQGIVEIEALCYIRGRSIPRRFFVLDEAQQLTPLEAKTIVTRMSKGSKLIMVGDPAQIDNPYVDSRSNGLVYTRNRLKGNGIAAHVTLNKGERSALAEIGAKLM
jgi:PhoH-like ATPase